MYGGGINNDLSFVLGAPNANSAGLNYALSIRIERPIASCEIAPHPYLTIKGGAMDNNTRAKLMEANPHDFSIRWSRGPRRPVCANSYCPRGNTFDPVNWSKFACGGPGLRCAVCERARASRQDSSFCSSQCFKQAWQHHSSLMHTGNPGPGTKSGSRLGQTSDEVSDPEFLGAALGQAPYSRGQSSSVANLTISSNDDNLNTEDWVEISTERSYSPTLDDVGCILRVEVRAFSTGDGSLIAGPAVTFTEPVLSPPHTPPKRALVTVPGALSGVTISARFRVISYNILAEIYSTKQAYPYCDGWSLGWSYRQKIILDELEESQGDIICLQELQSDHYEQSFYPFMQNLGYDGLYKQKSREAMGQYGKVDGCALFWRRSKFILAESYTIDFNESARRAATNLNLDETECRRYINRLNKDNIAQVIFLEVLNAQNLAPPRNPGGRPPRTIICVANTHLFSNHMRPDVKLWQSCTLINELEQLIVPRDIPLILCGDFNSEPDSAVYEFIDEGVIERPHPEIEESDSLHVLPDLRNLGHSLDLSSMMNTALGAEPIFTNYTANFKGTLDYIWYSPGRMRVLAASALPDEQHIQEACGEGLPSPNYPSDHIVLCCDVALVTGSSAGPITRAGTTGPMQIRSHIGNMGSNQGQQGGGNGFSGITGNSSRGKPSGSFAANRGLGRG